MRRGVTILALLLLLSAAAWADKAPGPRYPRPTSQPSTQPTTQPAVASMPLSFVAGGLLVSSALIGGGLLLSRRRRGH
jgi:hypothetical protein